MIRKIALLTLSILILILLSDFSFGQSEKPHRQYILIADIQIAKQLKDISIYKVEAALNLACEVSGKYRLIPIFVRDSIVDIFSKEGKEPTIAQIASHLKADRIVFINVNSIGNMLRVAFSGVNTHDSSDGQGTGYSQIRYREEKTNKIVYDPTLLTALQRAFAGMLKDSLLYNDAKGAYRVFPAKTIAIGGIDFQDDTSQIKWDLFSNKTIVSYNAIENIFDEAFKNDKYVLYDIETRDSIYSFFKLFLIENSNPPNKAEIDALSKFEVDYYLTGSLRRVASGAIVELYLCRIFGSDLEIVRKEMDVVTNDSKVEFIDVLKRMTRKLLEIK